MSESVGTWLRGLVWTAMIFGCAWASAQNYMVQPAAGHYHAVAMGAGEGVGLSEGIGASGAQNAEQLPKDDLFAGTDVFAKNATHVTEITMDPDTLNMVGGPDKGRAHSMVLNVVRTFTYDKPGMYNMADVDAIRSKLNTGDWHCSVHVRDLKDGSGSDVCNKRRTDGMRESAIISVEPKELTFIHTIRKAGPGESELGYFPMLPGLNGLSSLAMIDPEAFADMQIGLHGMPMVFAGPGAMTLTAPGSKLYKLNSPEMKQQMDKMNEQMKQFKLHPPIDPEQMQKLQEQMKDFQKNFYKDKEKGAETPVAPDAPQAAPAPAVPEPPQ